MIDKKTIDKALREAKDLKKKQLLSKDEMGRLEKEFKKDVKELKKDLKKR